MSSARRNRWTVNYVSAIEFLEDRGFKLTSQWEWEPPTRHHTINWEENDAIIFLIQEWDFGGMTEWTGGTDHITVDEKGWWWWDETDSNSDGPFPTPEIAAAALALYVKDYLHATI